MDLNPFLLQSLLFHPPLYSTYVTSAGPTGAGDGTEWMGLGHYSEGNLLLTAMF